MVEWQPKGVPPQQGEYRYVVKEGDSGPWIVAEPAGNSLKIVGTNGEDMNFGFRLRPRTTIQEAHALAKAMNERITEIELW
jgi:hypothetical protein